MAVGAILKGQDQYGKALTAEGATIGGTVFIGDGFKTDTGGVSFQAGTIGGNFQAGGAILKGHDQHGDALTADGAKIGGAVLIRDGFTTETGGVRFYGATIGGNFGASGAILKGQDQYGDALTAEGATIGGTVFIGDGFKTDTGGVSFHGAKIGGSFEASGAILKGHDQHGDALTAEGATIGGAVLLRDGFTTETGGVRFYGATIGGNFGASGAILKGQDQRGDALTAVGAKIGGAVLLRDGFTTETGGVRFYGATIGGNVEAQDGDFRGVTPYHFESSDEGVSLNFYGATIKGRLQMRDFKTPPRGAVILADARAKIRSVMGQGEKRKFRASFGKVPYNGFGSRKLQ